MDFLTLFLFLVTYEPGCTSKLLKQVHLMACRTRGQPLHSRMAVIMRNCIPQLGLQAATYKNMPYQSGLGSLNVNIT
jgi:hypothetical protein